MKKIQLFSFKKAFIIPVQIAYTLCFLTCLALFFMILIYIAKYRSRDEGIVPYLIVIGMMLNGAGNS
jgi:ABC-type transport system involved in cytochrome c biogenesis permease subunit